MNLYELGGGWWGGGGWSKRKNIHFFFRHPLPATAGHALDLHLPPVEGAVLQGLVVGDHAVEFVVVDATLKIRIETTIGAYVYLYPSALILSFKHYRGLPTLF